MWVKICANTNLADAKLAAELGADAVGFVFASSKRQVTAEQVAEITLSLPDTVEKVGVFSSTDADEILDAANASGLTMVQLHSAFDAKLAQRMSDSFFKVLQVVDVSPDMSEETLRQALLAPLRNADIEAVLLDASHGGQSGGTGKTFDWERMYGVVRDVQQETGGRVIIAGGLNPENVSLAIETFQPFGVDVASGTEATPSKKDPAKLRVFIQAAKAPR